MTSPPLSSANKIGLVVATLCFVNAAWSKYNQEAPLGSFGIPAAPVLRPVESEPQKDATATCRYDTEFDLKCQPQEAYANVERNQAYAD